MSGVKGVRCGTWRRLEHTADLKVEFAASDRAGLFAAGAEFIFATMLDRAAIRERIRRTVSLQSSGPDELFLDWLRELLFLFGTRGFVVAAVTGLEFAPGGESLRAELSGEEYDPVRHGLKLEIKSPTYHQYRFESGPAGLRSVVLFDV